MLVTIIAQILGLVKFTKQEGQKVRKPVRISNGREILCGRSVYVAHGSDGDEHAARSGVSGEVIEYLSAGEEETVPAGTRGVAGAPRGGDMIYIRRICGGTPVGRQGAGGTFEKFSPAPDEPGRRCGSVPNARFMSWIFSDRPCEGDDQSPVLREIRCSRRAGG